MELRTGHDCYDLIAFLNKNSLIHMTFIYVLLQSHSHIFKLLSFIEKTIEGFKNIASHENSYFSFSVVIWTITSTGRF